MLKEILGDIAPLGPTGLLSVMVVLIMTGRLVPRDSVMRSEASFLREIEGLRAVNSKMVETVEQQADTIRDLLEGARLANDVASAIKTSGGS